MSLSVPGLEWLELPGTQPSLPVKYPEYHQR